MLDLLGCFAKKGGAAMSQGIDPSVYRSVLRVRMALPFDIGALLMRVYICMATIGTISMLTLAGYSFFVAGTVSSTLAFATFLISPRVSRRVDERGQSAVVPKAAVVTLSGLALMLAVVCFQGPFYLCYPAAVLMGFVPNAQALARARWTHLIREGVLGSDAPSIKTVFSYEGVIDDVAFMVGPSCSIALAAGVAPAAGMLLGGVCFAAGAAILTASRATEPAPSGAADGSAEGRGRSMFGESPVVRILFFLMLLMGAFYGIFDAATISFAEDIGAAAVASGVLMAAAVVSITSGAVFGMIRLGASQRAQLMAVSLLIGAGYGSMALIDSVPSLLAVSTVAALFYAPFLITVSATCEAAVPLKRLTEAMTWINSGSTLGLALGPTLGGYLIDSYGTAASFGLGAAFALAIPVVAFFCLPILRRRLS